MEIEWSLLASRQLNDVLDFVATEYGSITARKVFDKFDANVNSLLRNPNLQLDICSYSLMCSIM